VPLAPQAEVSALQCEIQDLGGVSTINLNSTRELSALIFDKLQLDTKASKKNTTGWSTAAVGGQSRREEDYWG
jgi:DNA polymerase I-like protein with 3'-5' exonuclease and polymerase domains